MIFVLLSNILKVFRMVKYNNLIIIVRKRELFILMNHKLYISLNESHYWLILIKILNRNKYNIYEWDSIVGEEFALMSLLLHNVPLQLQIVALALPISIVLQLFDASPFPQPSPRTKTNFESQDVIIT